MRAIATVLVLVAVLSGCTSPNSRASHVALGSTKGLVTTGNLRIVSERKRLGYPPVVCTEPSPDYAIAFGFTRKANADLPSPAGTQTLSAELASTETVTAGSGREAAVLALRDGLYSACQSYANGVIGHDAYAMILSQFGALLVALVGNDGAKGTTSIGTRNATLSALTVACVSSHDQTRGPWSNALLTPSFCYRVFEQAMAQRG